MKGLIISALKSMSSAQTLTVCELIKHSVLPNVLKGSSFWGREPPRNQRVYTVPMLCSLHNVHFMNEAKYLHTAVCDYCVWGPITNSYRRAFSTDWDRDLWQTADLFESSTWRVWDSKHCPNFPKSESKRSRVSRSIHTERSGCACVAHCALK